MWAPADLFGPAVNAIGLSLQRLMTFLSEHLVLSLIAAAGVVVVLVLVKTLRPARDKS